MPGSTVSERAALEFLLPGFTFKHALPNRQRLGTCEIHASLKKAIEGGPLVKSLTFVRFECLRVDLQLTAISSVWPRPTQAWRALSGHGICPVGSEIGWEEVSSPFQPYDHTLFACAVLACTSMLVCPADGLTNSLVIESAQPFQKFQDFCFNDGSAKVQIDLSCRTTQPSLCQVCTQVQVCLRCHVTELSTSQVCAQSLLIEAYF